MSTTVTSINVTATITGSLAPASSSVLTGNLNVNDVTTKTPAIGTSTNQVAIAWTAVRSVTSGSPDILDLTALTDAIGNSISPTKLVGYKIENQSSTAGEILTLGGGTGSVFASDSTHPVGPGGVALYYDPAVGITITDTSADKFQVAAAAGTVSYKLTLLFR